MFLRKTATGLLLATLLLCLLPISVFAAGDTIGYIDAQLVLVSHPKYASSQKQLEEFSKKKASEAKEAAAKESDPNKRRVIIDTARRESGEEELRVMKPITLQINGVIESVAKKRGISVVLNRVEIFFGGVDLTEEVVKGVKEIK